jgi:hypothetical protein
MLAALPDIGPELFSMFRFGVISQGMNYSAPTTVIMYFCLKTKYFYSLSLIAKSAQTDGDYILVAWNSLNLADALLRIRQIFFYLVVF